MGQGGSKQEPTLTEKNLPDQGGKVHFHPVPDKAMILWLLTFRPPGLHRNWFNQRRRKRTRCHPLQPQRKSLPRRSIRGQSRHNNLPSEVQVPVLKRQSRVPASRSQRSEHDKVVGSGVSQQGTEIGCLVE
jgi:hypothetical protein